MNDRLPWLAELASDNVSRRELTKRLSLVADGQQVNIVGAGPSASAFKHEPGTWTIALNAAIKLFLKTPPDKAKKLVAMSSENQAYLFPWFWDNASFAGSICAEKYMGRHMPEAFWGGYSREWWERVLWFERVPWNGEDLRFFTGGKTRYGLCYLSGQFDPVGGVAMQAVHLAMLMGAAEIHTWGTELSFPAGTQHFDGWEPYSETTEDVYQAEATQHQVKVVRCSLTAEGDAVLDPEGSILTTPYFMKCAAAIRKVQASQPEVRFVDHSNGLLTGKPAPLIEVAAAEALQAQGDGNGEVKSRVQLRNQEG